MCFCIACKKRWAGTSPGAPDVGSSPQNLLVLLNALQRRSVSNITLADLHRRCIWASLAPSGHHKSRAAQWEGAVPSSHFIRAQEKSLWCCMRLSIEDTCSSTSRRQAQFQILFLSHCDFSSISSVPLSFNRTGLIFSLPWRIKSFFSHSQTGLLLQRALVAEIQLLEKAWELVHVCIYVCLYTNCIIYVCIYTQTVIYVYLVPTEGVIFNTYLTVCVYKLACVCVYICVCK